MGRWKVYQGIERNVHTSAEAYKVAKYVKNHYDCAIDIGCADILGNMWDMAQTEETKQAIYDFIHRDDAYDFNTLSDKED